MKGFKDLVRAQHTEQKQNSLATSADKQPFHLPLCTSISAGTSLTNTHPWGTTGPPRAAAHFVLLRIGWVAAVLRETISKMSTEKKGESGTCGN